MIARWRVVLLVVVLAQACVQPDPGSAPNAAATAANTPASRAVAYLQEEVPRWRTENGCYSCHNNGDAARALYLWATLTGQTDDGISETSAWLRQPDQWEHNGGEGPFSDKRLARIQFAAALVSAEQAGFVQQPRALGEAANQLASDQLDSGAWQEASGLIGSPVTYGPFLATYMARRTLVAAGALRYREPIARADRWFRETPVKTVMAAAATLLALEGAEDPEANTLRATCLDLIRRGESPDGGWGPFTNSPPEVFDTALTVLGILQFREDPEWAETVERGRRYLIATQDADGGWVETTRPSGYESYAQHISTTGWSTQALLLSDGP
jgi:hypothetical protein